MKNDKRILIIGSVAIDSIETPFGKRDAILGGSATYSSISSSFFTRQTGIVAVIGEDFPKKYCSILEAMDINLEGLKTMHGKTFRWKGNYSYDLHSPVTVFTHLNVFKDFKPVIPESQRTSPFLFLANIDPELQETVLSQAKGAKLIVCDTMNFWIENKPKALKRLLKKVDMFLLNEGEARQMSGEKNLMKAAKSIMSQGAKSVIIKKGEHGVLFFSKRFHFSSPAYLLETICDPTGAGDTFAGGMLGYLSHKRKINERNIRKSLIYGNIMASFVVEDFSVDRMVRLNRRQIENRYKEFERITRF